MSIFKSDIRNDKDDIFDISAYTDDELYRILDIHNPSDRELEAVIISHISKYEPETTTTDINLYKFFSDMYSRFFDITITEESSKEGFESMQNNTDSTPISENNAPNSSSNDPVISDTTYTQNLEYSPGTLNPTLKETIKRVVSIDSQYRDRIVYPNPTDYIFNLSDILQDVVSIKLYSVQIPNTFYTINRNYGSNFFYIRATTPGINTGHYDAQITVSSGNYVVLDLVNAANTALQTTLVDSNSDVSYGSTSIIYNQSTIKATIKLEILHIYNETVYSLIFPFWTNPMDPLNIGEFESIPGFLGFNSSKYTPLKAYSTRQASLLLTPATGGVAYSLSTAARTFHIYGYIGPDAFDSSRIDDTTYIMISIPIVLDIITSKSEYYYRTDLLTNVNEKLAESTYLLDASFSVEDISNIDSALGKVMMFTARLNRFTTKNVKHMKTVIVFPEDTNIWLGNQSCFCFASSINELNNIYSETPNYFTRYMVSSSPYAYLKCKTPYYGSTDTTVNDIQFTIPNSTSTGYLITEFSTAIQSAMDNLRDLQSANGFFCNTDILSFAVNPFPTITFDILRTFGTQNFALDITNSFFTTNSAINITDTDSIVNSTLADSKDYGILNLITSTFTSDTMVFYSRFKYRPTGYSITKFTNKLILKSVGSYVINVPDIEIEIPLPINSNGVVQTTFDNYRDMELHINSVFSSSTYNPTEYGQYITGTNISFSATPDMNNYIYCTLTVKVSTQLSEYNYDVYLYDPAANDTYNTANPLTPIEWSESTQIWESTSNVWYNYLNFSSPSYALLEISGDTYINGDYSVISGVKAILSNQLYLTSNNNYFYIQAEDIYGGIYTASERTDNSNLKYNDYIIQIDPILYPVGQYYSSLVIVQAIQSAMDAVPGLVGSSISIDLTTYITNIRLSVSRIFTAKDYSVVFYDNQNFSRCNSGIQSSITNVTWDSTLGWILGFRDSTQYDMLLSNMSTNIYGDTYYFVFPNTNFYVDPDTNITSLTGDTAISINLYSYFMIVLDDYSLSHINDGLVTTTTRESQISLPSYANKTSRRCNPVSGKITVANHNPGPLSNSGSGNSNGLTAAQIYSANQILTADPQVQHQYSQGVYIQDVFGIIPLNTTKIASGQSYIEFGGSLQIQERTYFGPVNISRMSVKLLNDKGQVVDLNSANWSFSLIVEKLYSPNKI